MSWLVKSLSSSLGRKLLMSFTGLFLCSFLVIHLIGNLQIIHHDQGVAFNVYAKFMSTNPIIHFVSYGLYAGILLHTFVAVALTIQNNKARPQGYAASNNQSSWASRSMMLLGTLILFFILVHMGDFWWHYKYAQDPAYVTDLYKQVVIRFQNPVWMLIYTISQIVLAFHLSHGFASAFQTLGLNHKKYSPAIKYVGYAFAIIVPALFAYIPLYAYFCIDKI